MMKSPAKFGARNQKRSCLCIALGAFLSALGVSILLSLVFWSRLSASISRFARDGCDPTAIVILGGGVAADGGVPEHTSERVKLALQVDQELKQCAVFVTLSGGTPHKPNPVDSKGFPIWEATAAAKALLDAGISAERILEESFSLDTIGNAYYLRTVHMEPSQLRKMIVITNNWHMPRTRAIFDFVFSLPTVHNALAWLERGYEITYRAAPAGIRDEHLLRVRQDKEASSLVYFTNKVVPQIQSMQDMHLWLFRQHSAYATSRLVAKSPEGGGGASSGSGVSAELLKTY